MKQWYALIFFIVILQGLAKADIIIFNNNDTVECEIVAEGPTYVETNIQSGTFRFNKNEIKSIQRSSARENEQLKERWQRQKTTQAERLSKRQAAAEAKSKRMHAPSLEIKKRTEMTKSDEPKHEQVRIDIRKPKEERSQWGRIVKSDWKQWGSDK